jgi:branched-chain amino acid transport system substrate-binding protein
MVVRVNVKARELIEISKQQEEGMTKLTQTHASRRWITTAAFAALLALAAPAAHAQAKKPIKIGILAPYSGVFALFGPKVIEEPIRLYLKEHNNQIAGNPVEVVVVDDQSKPDGSVEKAKELVESHKVDVIIGLVNSAGALAVRDYLDQKQVLTIITVAGAKEMTQSRKSSSIFRVSFANGQTEAAGAVLAKVNGLQTMAAIGADYVAGHQLLEPLIKNFETLGGKVPKTLWHPLGTADFSPYLTELKQLSGQVQAVSPMMFGADATRFFNQYKEFGIRIPIYAFGDVTEQTLFLDSVGEAAIGTTTYWTYSPYLDNPANNAFRAAFRKTYNRLPGAFSMHAYAAMQFLDAAVAKGGGNMTDGKAVREAMETVKIDSPAGPLFFDKDHGVVFNVYLNEVRKGPDGIVAQIPRGPMVTNVDQHQTLEQAQKNLKQ